MNGDTVIQEIALGPSKIHFVVKYNESGYYESWQEYQNGLLHGIGMKYDNSFTWHNQYSINGKTVKIVEIEVHKPDGIEWKTIELFEGKYSASKTGSVKYE